MNSLRRVSIASDNPSKYAKILFPGSSHTLRSGTIGRSGIEDWLPDARPVHSSLPHEGFSARNEDWTSVQKGVVALFQKKDVSVTDVEELRVKVGNLVKSEIGPLIHDYYTNQLCRKGMRLMRERIKKETEEGDFFEALGSNWSFFYMEILPVIQSIFFPVQAKHLSIKQGSLVMFRDHILIKEELDFQGALKRARLEDIPPSIKQMLLVLQSVCECMPPSGNYLKLESLVGQVVVPFLGYQGLFIQSAEPVIHSNLTDLHTQSGRVNDQERKPKVHSASPLRQFVHIRQTSTPSSSSSLSPVAEYDLTANDGYRRHSVCIS